MPRTTRAGKPARPARSAPARRGAAGIRLPYPSAYLADMFAKVGCGALYAGLAGDKAYLGEVERNGKLTPEMERMADMPVPPEVRAWMRTYLRSDAVHAAVRSQMAIALERHQKRAPKQRPGSSPNGGGPSAEHSHCKPYCEPP